ncbi:MAG: glycosyltransferase family 4 protein [Aureispira sp.]
MKILQLCKKFPYPLKDGEAIAITYLARALHTLGAELTLLSMNTSKHYFDNSTLPEDVHHYKSIHLIDIDNRVNAKDAFWNLFTSQSYHIARFVSKAFEAKLIELLSKESYDIVQLETLYLAPYVETIRKYSKAKIVMRSHNVEHEIWQRVTSNTAWGLKKIYLHLLTSRLKNFELERLNKYDLLVAITARDLDFFSRLGSRVPSHVTPIGLDLQDYTYQVKPPQKHPSFCFIGSLDWMPNTEGVEWILEKVWPRVLEQQPQAHFHIAGRNTPQAWLEKTWPNVTIHGEVHSATEFIQAHDVMLVPLFSGSGMRVKILEGMALGKVVVSTSLGLEGIAAGHNKEVFIADTVEAFVQVLVQCQQMPQALPQIGAAAVDFLHEHYDNVRVAEKLLLRYQQLLPATQKVVLPS